MFFFLINRLYRVKLVSGEKDNLLPFSLFFLHEDRVVYKHFNVAPLSPLIVHHFIFIFWNWTTVYSPIQKKTAFIFCFIMLETWM